MGSDSGTLTSDTLPELQPENTRTQRDINWIIKYLRNLVAGGGGHIILDDGATMPQRIKLDFVGNGVQVVDAPASGSTRVLVTKKELSPGADVRIVNSVVQRAGNGVLLFSGGQELLREYATITEALGDAVSGDIVEIPAGTYTEDVTVPAEVTLRGRGRGSIISGTVTLNGILDNCSVIQNVGSDTDVVAVIAGPGALLSHVAIQVSQYGPGKALGLLGISGEGEPPTNAYDCDIFVSGTSSSAWGYGAIAEGGLRLHQGSVVGVIPEEE